MLITGLGSYNNNNNNNNNDDDDDDDNSNLLTNSITELTSIGRYISVTSIADAIM